MTQTANAPIAELRAALHGEVVEATDPTYDEARKVWNAAIDRRPLAVAMCVDDADVQTAVRFAATHGVEIAVRCGAHSMSGAGVIDDGLVIDLSRMNDVSVDPEARRAKVGGGALLGALDAATQAHGLAVPVGLISHTGVGGLTLGGGMGWLSRKHGLSIDNLVSARCVTADGDVLTASATENPDLFWALRGGGGNFAIVTEFEFELHEAGPMIHFGLVFWTLDQGAEALRHARTVIASLPDDVNVVVGGLNAPPAPFVPEEHQLQPGYAMVIVGFGSAEEHAAVVEQAGAAVPPAFVFATPMPYVALQQMLDEANGWGHYCYDKGCYVEDLSDERHRRPRRALPPEDLADVDRAVLPPRRRLLGRRRGRHRLQRRPLAALRRLHHRRLPCARRCWRRSGTGRARSRRPWRRTLPATAPTSTARRSSTPWSTPTEPRSSPGSSS